MGQEEFVLVGLLLLTLALAGMVVFAVMLVIAIGAALVGAVLRLVVLALGSLVRVSVIRPRTRRGGVPGDEPLWRVLDDQVRRAA